MRAHFFVVGLTIGLILFSALTAAAWTGPSSSPPNNNVSAPFNVGTLSQVKNGSIGVNGLAVYGNSLLDWNVNGGGTLTYLNFSDLTSNPLTQSSGYGIRDNAGTLEFKNSGGSWQSLQAVISGLGGGYWAETGTTVYYNGGNVSVGGGNIYASNSGNVTASVTDSSSGRQAALVTNQGGNTPALVLTNGSASTELLSDTSGDMTLYSGPGNKHFSFYANGSTVLPGSVSAGNAVFSGDVSIGTTNVINLLTIDGNIADEGQPNCNGTDALQTNSNGTIYCASGYVTNGSSPTFGDVYVNNWYRVNSSGGIYWQSYGGGWYMVDSTWIRSYGGKPVYMDAGFDTGNASGIGCGGGLGAGYMLRVCGSEDVSSSVTSGAFYYNSDERLKHNIASIATSTALSEVLALRPVTFNWNNVSLGTTTQLGFIAQEVQQVVPQIVETNASTTMESVDYARVTPLLVGSVQALDQTIQDQQQEIDSQQGQITAQQNAIASQQKEIDNLIVELQPLQHK